MDTVNAKHDPVAASKGVLRVTLSSSNAAKFYGGPSRGIDQDGVLFPALASPPIPRTQGGGGIVSSSSKRSISHQSSKGEALSSPPFASRLSPYAQPASVGASARSRSALGITSMSGSRRAGMPEAHHPDDSHAGMTEGGGGGRGEPRTTSAFGLARGAPRQSDAPARGHNASTDSLFNKHESSTTNELSQHPLREGSQPGDMSHTQSPTDTSHRHTHGRTDSSFAAPSHAASGHHDRGSASTSTTLLRKAVFGDSKARQIAAETLRIHAALDAALHAVEEESAAHRVDQSSGAHNYVSSESHVGVAHLRTYASALVTIISAMGIGKALPEVVKDLLSRIATGVHETAEQLDLHVSGLEALQGTSTAAEILAVAAAVAPTPTAAAVTTHHDVSPQHQAGGKASAASGALAPSHARTVLQPITHGATTQLASPAHAASTVSIPVDMKPSPASGLPLMLPPVALTSAGSPRAASHHDTTTAAAKNAVSARQDTHPGAGVRSEASSYHSSDDESDDGFGDWAPSRTGTEGGTVDADNIIASVIREPTQIAQPPNSPASAKPQLGSLASGARSPIKSPAGIPKLGIALSSPAGLNSGANSMPSAEKSFQDEFMANHDTWSDSWREEAGVTVKTAYAHGAAAAVAALRRAAAPETVEEVPEEDAPPTP